MIQNLPWLFLLLPLAVAAINWLCFRKCACCAATLSILSALGTFGLCVAYLSGALPAATPDIYTWMPIFTEGMPSLSLGLLMDPLAMRMMLVVTGIGLLVHIFSIGYMKGDPSNKSRYFAGLSIFMFSMTMIVMADNLAMTFIGWEMVGFSSYLLIGHWFNKESAADAAKKAFITNRVGDFGFLIGILLTMAVFGTLTFSEMGAATAGIPAAIVGKPNAGKSSLLNALLGYERAIVTDIPGTTRDTIEEKLRLGSVTLRLTDTAGIHETEDVVERMGVERSRQAMENAMLVLVVIDGSRAPDEEDQTLIRQAEKAERAILVISKNDLDTAFAPVSTLPTVSVSAVTGDGLDELERLVDGMFPLPQVPAGEILTNARQAEAVKRALEHLDAALSSMEYGMTPDVVLTEAEGVMQSLGELTGRSIREDVTNRIFQRFCVGK